MAQKCFLCQKGNQTGRHISHRHSGLWKKKAPKKKRVFKANFHWAKMEVKGASRRVKLCSDCLSRMKKEGKVNVKKEIKKTVSKLAVKTPEPKKMVKTKKRGRPKKTASK